MAYLLELHAPSGAPRAWRRSPRRRRVGQRLHTAARSVRHSSIGQRRRRASRESRKSGLIGCGWPTIRAAAGRRGCRRRRGSRRGRRRGRRRVARRGEARPSAVSGGSASSPVKRPTRSTSRAAISSSPRCWSDSTRKSSAPVTRITLSPRCLCWRMRRTASCWIRGWMKSGSASWAWRLSSRAGRSL